MPVIVTQAPRPGNLAGAVYPLLITELEEGGEPRVELHRVIDAPHPTATSAGPAVGSGFVEFLCADRADALALRALLLDGPARITDDTVAPPVDLTVVATRAAARPTEARPGPWTVDAQWTEVEA